MGVGKGWVLSKTGGECLIWQVAALGSALERASARLRMMAANEEDALCFGLS